jgi:threonine dehydratase
VNAPFEIPAILEAAERIRPYAIRAPLKPSFPLSALTGKRILLKLESMQPSGSFKLRGAANAIVSLTLQEQQRGIITCSSGNHGRAVALVAQRLGLSATIFLSELVPGNKVRAIQELGATVIVAGHDSDTATDLAYAHAEEHGLTYIHPFDDPRVVAGQGTIGLEILDDLPDVDTLIVPTSGGGLIGGIALAIKSRRPDVRVIGVSMERGAAMHASLVAGEPVNVEEHPTLADALAGGIGLDNRLTFPLVRDYVDDLRLVSEDEIAAAMVHALLHERLVLEGGAATTLALLLRERDAIPGDTIVAVCTGDNVDMARLLELARR